MNRFAIGILVVIALGTGCSQLPGVGGGAPSPTAPAGPTPALDAAVPMPTGFPVEVPIYPKARLIAGAVFPGGGQQTWGMEWETTDDAAKVAAFYSNQLGSGDWTLTPRGQTAGVTYAASFARKSNPQEKGTFVIVSSGGVTSIALSLVSSS